MTRRQPPYIRRKKPPPLRLTRRDKRILETLHAFDGMMSLRQIDRLFFKDRGGSWPRERMRALFDNAYVAMPSAADVHRIPLGETAYFLDTRGAKVVAELHGETLEHFPWRKRPRFSLISHDLAVNDFRLDVMEACRTSPALMLHYWTPESAFRTSPDKISYETRGGTSRKRQIQPDGFFVIHRLLSGGSEEIEEYAFLLEIDMATEDNPRFAREKVRPGVAYLGSRNYQERFGIDYGRWLVITTGERRLENMKDQTERAGGQELFYFTTFDLVSPATVLVRPVWRLAGSGGPAAIVSL